MIHRDPAVAILNGRKRIPLGEFLRPLEPHRFGRRGIRFNGCPGRLLHGGKVICLGKK
jgi:hypothetical protein